ncbi:MAG TPA: TOBE domain-containing protein, partial [Casimicrobiaceae bacterium]|nr:TOBE domain-containing protein [Casimicrobiaceae bacterium]
SALDAPIRASLRAEIRRIQQQIRIAAIYVTHDQEEALALADRVVIMQGGKIREIGTPEQIYKRPQSAFTAAFVGSNNILTGEVVSKTPGEIRCDGTTLRCARLESAQPGDSVSVVVPAEHLQVAAVDVQAINVVSGPITLRTFHGPLTRIEVSAAGRRWIALLPSSAAAAYAVGEVISLSVAPDHCYVVEGDS